MITDPLFRADAYLREADSTVLAHTPEGGIVVDRYYYLAVPLDTSRVNNVLLVLDTCASHQQLGFAGLRSRQSVSLKAVRF